MMTFSREEQQLLLLLGLCSLVACAVLLCSPEYWKKVPLIANKQAHLTSHGKKKEVTQPLHKLNPNFASYTQLLNIPGIGPRLAKNILIYRENHIFFCKDDMLAVRGIGPKKWLSLSRYFVFQTESSTRTLVTTGK